MYCANCGKELLDSAKFCSACGARVEADVVETTRSYVDKASFDEDAPVKRPVTNKVVFDWSNVIDEPLKKDVPEVESPWGTEAPVVNQPASGLGMPEHVTESLVESAVEPEAEHKAIRFSDDDNLFEELNKPSTDPGRTMSFIDILKQEREERDVVEANQAEASKAVDDLIDNSEQAIDTGAAYSDYLNSRGTADENEAEQKYEDQLRAAAPQIYEPKMYEETEFIPPVELEQEDDDEDIVEIDFDSMQTQETEAVDLAEEEASKVLDDIIVELVGEDEDDNEIEEATETGETKETAEVDDDDEESDSESDVEDSYLNFDYVPSHRAMKNELDEEEDENDDSEDDESEGDESEEDESSDDYSVDGTEEEIDDEEDENAEEGDTDATPFVAAVAKEAEPESVESEIEALKRRLAELIGEDNEEPIEIPKADTVTIEDLVEPQVEEESVEEHEHIEDTVEEPAQELDDETIKESAESPADLFEELMSDSSDVTSDSSDEIVEEQNDDLDVMLGEILGQEVAPVEADASIKEIEDNSDENTSEEVIETTEEVVAVIDAPGEDAATDAMSIEDLEKELFGDEAAVDDAENEATKKIDKFYTLYKKNEEFQQLLDEEYNKLNGGEESSNEVPNVDALLSQKEDIPAPALETPAIASPVTAEPAEKAAVAETPAAPALEEASAPVSKKEVKAQKKAAKKAALEELDDDEEGGNALTVIAIIIAVLLVILLVVILILNFFPDTGAASAISSVLEKVTNLFASVPGADDSFLL